MIQESISPDNLPSNPPKFTERRFIVTMIFVSSLFMFWGIANTMSDVLNKHFQNVLQLSKAKSALIQFSVFGAYFLMSIPAGLFLKRFGYKNGVLFGLILFALGTFLFIPAANAGSFSFFRIALFILGCGMATLETVAHPFAVSLGDQRSSDQRVNFAQSFNALGTMIGPFIGSYFLLRSGNMLQPGNLDAVKNLYMWIGIVILLVAGMFALVKVPILTDLHQEQVVDPKAQNIDLAPDRKLYQHQHFVWAVIAQFFNVAAQAGCWGYFINYGHEIMGFSDQKAGNLMVGFMGMMLLGRFVGTYLMRYIAANKLLAIFALGNVLACLIVAQGWGMVSYGTLFSINFFISIMFPTIFSLGLKNLGRRTQQASSYISMGVVGGAFFPFLMGLVANHDIAKAYYLPIICYAIIFLFGYRMYKVRA